jgi:hypothetical protein
MDLAQAFGEDNGMGLPDEFLLWIAEHLLGLGVDKQNGPKVVDDHDPFGERLQEGAYRDIPLEKSGGKGYLPLNS